MTMRARLNAPITRVIILYNPEHYDRRGGGGKVKEYTGRTDISNPTGPNAK